MYLSDPVKSNRSDKVAPIYDFHCKIFSFRRKNFYNLFLFFVFPGGGEPTIYTYKKKGGGRAREKFFKYNSFILLTR